MNRPQLYHEERDPEKSRDRAIVANASAVWAFLVALVTFFSFLVGAGWWAANTLNDIRDKSSQQNVAQDTRIDGLTGRVATVEVTIQNRKTDRDKQFEDIDGRLDGLESRMRPLESTSASTASSLAFIRDQIAAGLSEISRRLDRIEGSKQ